MATETQELAEAVAAWLHYKELTGLRGLLNESSMTLPIAEYLASKHGTDVDGEVAHPAFKKGAKGRPKQIDFVRKRRGDGLWISAYECKFTNPNHSLIVQDLCRLVCLSQWRSSIGTPDRFFLYAGKLNKGALLSCAKFNTGESERRSFFEGMFSEKTDQPNVSIRVTGLHREQLKWFIRFTTETKISVPSVISTKLLGWAAVGSIGCAIWRVTQSKGSKLLAAEDLKEGRNNLNVDKQEGLELEND